MLCNSNRLGLPYWWIALSILADLVDWENIYVAMEHIGQGKHIGQVVNCGAY